MLDLDKGKTMNTKSFKLRVVLYTVLFIAIFLHIILLAYRWNHPILDIHKFRQTQTALSVYWLLKGGNWLSYETPVIGAPWSIPFEFPLYQWCVAFIKQLIKVPLDSAGRLTSLIFFFLTLLACRAFFRELKLDKLFFPVFSILLLASPLYIFWSSTFMIESSALFLAVSFLVFLQKYLKDSSVWNFLMVTLIAVLGVLVKATTFSPFAYVGIILVIVHIINNWKNSFSPQIFFRKYLPIAFVFLTAFFAVLEWTNFADDLKAQNYIGKHLTSEALHSWHFSDLETRLSKDFWRTTIFGRSANQILGTGTLLCFLAGLLLLCSRKTIFMALVAFSAYIATFLLFPRLHLVHNYYQYANGIFIIFMASAIVVGLPQDRIKPLVLIIILCLQLGRFYYSEYYQVLFLESLYNHKTLRVSNLIRENTPEETAILVFGIKWSSEIAYYSQRRAITFANWLPPNEKRVITSNPKDFTNGLPISAIVICGDLPNGVNKNTIDEFASNASAYNISNSNCVVYIEQLAKSQEFTKGILEWPSIMSKMLDSGNQDPKWVKIEREQLFAHAPSSLSFPFSNAEKLNIKLGIRDGAWQKGNTDGVLFVISLLNSGEKVEIWSRLLNPKEAVQDRGEQTASINLSQKEGTLIFETKPHGNNAWDWSYWSMVQLQ